MHYSIKYFHKILPIFKSLSFRKKRKTTRITNRKMGLSRIVLRTTRHQHQPLSVGMLHKNIIIIILRFVLLISLIVLCIVDASKNNSSQTRRNINSSYPSPSPSNDNSKDHQESTRVISLAESINRSRKLYQDPERAKGVKRTMEEGTRGN